MDADSAEESRHCVRTAVRDGYKVLVEQCWYVPPRVKRHLRAQLALSEARLCLACHDDDGALGSGAVKCR